MSARVSRQPSLTANTTAGPGLAVSVVTSEHAWQHVGPTFIGLRGSVLARVLPDKYRVVLARRVSMRPRAFSAVKMTRQPSRDVERKKNSYVFILVAVYVGRRVFEAARQMSTADMTRH